MLNFIKSNGCSISFTSISIHVISVLNAIGIYQIYTT